MLLVQIYIEIFHLRLKFARRNGIVFGVLYQGETAKPTPGSGTVLWDVGLGMQFLSLLVSIQNK